MAYQISINEVRLMGGVGKEPVIQEYTETKGPRKGEKCRVMRFPLATSTGYYNDKRQKKKLIQWHNIITRSEKIINRLEGRVVTGTQLYIVGSVRYQTWTDKRDRVQRKSTEIHIHMFQFAGGPRVGKWAKGGEDENKPNVTPGINEQFDMAEYEMYPENFSENTTPDIDYSATSEKTITDSDLLN